MRKRLRKLRKWYMGGIQKMADQIAAPNNKKQELQLSDIAKALQLSTSTVSRAISGKGRIGDDTRRRVLDYIDACDYRPNSIARSLAKSCTYNLCVAMPKDSYQSELPFFQSALMGVCEQANASDYDVLVACVDNNDVSALKRMLTNKKVDGVILTRTQTEDPTLEYLKASGAPFVLIGSSTDAKVPCIDVDNRAASRALCAYMLRKGYKRFALFLGRCDNTVNAARREGLLDALRAACVPDERILKIDGLTGRQQIQQALTRARAAACDCILCGDDYIANRLLSAAERVGAKQIHVASCYHSVLLESCRPRIPAVEIDAHAMGKLAAQSLLLQIQERVKGEKRMTESYRILDESGSPIA